MNWFLKHSALTISKVPFGVEFSWKKEFLPSTVNFAGNFGQNRLRCAGLSFDKSFSPQKFNWNDITLASEFCLNQKPKVGQVLDSKQSIFRDILFSFWQLWLLVFLLRKSWKLCVQHSSLDISRSRFACDLRIKLIRSSSWGKTAQQIFDCLIYLLKKTSTTILSFFLQQYDPLFLRRKKNSLTKQ